VLRWAAADTAAAWKECTKRLSAFSWIKGPARESGAFLLCRNSRGPACGLAIRLAISFPAVLHGKDFDRVVGVAESNSAASNAKTELRRLNVL
jgi:hypothetical protein